MEKERFVYVCVQTEQGRDVFVNHPGSGEEGRVVDCSGDQVMVENSAGEKRQWNYREVEEITRSKNEWPRRN
jgi:hypothetical protein